MLVCFQAGYRNNTLGLPKLCPVDNIDKIDTKQLYTYLNSFYDPSRMVIAAVGTDHDVLVELVTVYTLYSLIAAVGTDHDVLVELVTVYTFVI